MYIGLFYSIQSWQKQFFCLNIKRGYISVSLYYPIKKSLYVQMYLSCIQKWIVMRKNNLKVTHVGYKKQQFVVRWCVVSTSLVKYRTDTRFIKN